MLKIMFQVKFKLPAIFISIFNKNFFLSFKDLSLHEYLSPKLMVMYFVDNVYKSFESWFDQNTETYTDTSVNDNRHIYILYTRPMLVHFLRIIVPKATSVNIDIFGYKSQRINLVGDNYNGVYELDERSNPNKVSIFGIKEQNSKTICEVEIFGKFLPNENANLISNSSWKIWTSYPIESNLQYLTDEDWSQKICTNITAFPLPGVKTSPWISVNLGKVYKVDQVILSLASLIVLDISITDFTPNRNNSQYPLYQPRSICKSNIREGPTVQAICKLKPIGRCVVLSSLNDQPLKLCELTVNFP